MVDCPKCQFNQPKDQFCANCGIDMERYAQKHGTNSSKSLKPVLWGSAALALLLGVFVLTSLFKAPIFFGDEDELSLQEERIESFGRFNLGEQQRAVSSDPQALSAPQEASPSSMAQSTPQESAAPQAPQIFRLNFALVPADVVAKWIQDSTDFSSTGSISSGVLGINSLNNPSIENILSFSAEDLAEGLPFVTSLEEVGVDAIGFNLEGDWDDGVLSLEAILMNVDEREGDSSSSWRERESVQRWTFDMKSGSPLFIVGLMPRPLQTRRTTPWNLPGLFDLWDSEDFVMGQKELVLIIAPGR